MGPKDPLEDTKFPEPVLFDWVDFGEKELKENEWPPLSEVLNVPPDRSATLAFSFVDGWAPEDSYSNSPIVLGSKKMRRGFELELGNYFQHSGGESAPKVRWPTLWFWEDIEFHPSTPVVEQLSLPTVFRSPRVRSGVWVIRSLMPSDSRLAVGQDIQLPAEAIVEILCTPATAYEFRPTWEQVPSHTGLRLIVEGKKVVNLVYTSLASVSWVRRNDKRWSREPGNFEVDEYHANQFLVSDGALALALWDAGERRLSAYKSAKLGQPPEQIPGF